MHQSTKNKFYLKKHNQLIRTNSNDVNITINPEKYINKGIFNLNHVNSKWFLNLSKTELPYQVSTLCCIRPAGVRFPWRNN